MVAVLNRETTAVRAKEMMITPRLASDWLDKMGKNRRVSQGLVDKYAADMAEGRWLANGQTIVMGKSGLILDGQHRLLAIVKANMTVPMIVVSGVDDEAFKTIDTGRSRTVSDVLHVMGYPSNVLLAAVARQWLIYTESGEFVVTASDLTSQRVIDAAVANADEFEVAIKAASATYKALKGSQAVWCVLWMTLGDIDPLDRDLFFDGLARGAELATNSPVFALRRYFLEQQAARGKRTQIRPNMQGALIIKAWNKFRNHEPTVLMTWRANEAFPQPM